ncbi:MAG: guaA [Enterovirga sp.]|jgi:GMP synthase (glutamine-hydrolysing)|nr:guaA [Enterovirga sp.]
MAGPLRFLVAESEPPRARAARRDSVGRSSGETYLDILRRLAPGASLERVKPADPGGDAPGRTELGGYDAVFLTGSPLHLYEDTPETRRQVAFMRAVFAAGTPAFGSCAGLQVATVAAGGTVRPNSRGPEAPFARAIAPTAAGAAHPLLAGRPARYDAPSIHSDEVGGLPDGATLLAGNDFTTVQAAEIRSGDGVFWGVQYHPELTLREVAAALRRQDESLVGTEAMPDRDTLETEAGWLDALDAEPGRADLATRLGVDAEVTDPDRRRRELRNFIDALVKPTRSRRGRA